MPGILIAISTKPSTWSLGIERCDTCERFESDEAAFRFVREIIIMGGNVAAYIASGGAPREGSFVLVPSGILEAK